MITSNVYVFNNIAYISDCNFISNLYVKHFKNLDYLIIDALRYSKHPSHFSVEEAINFSKKLKPKKTILTNLHTDLDYSKLRKSLPKIFSLTFYRDIINISVYGLIPSIASFGRNLVFTQQFIVI